MPERSIRFSVCDDRGLRAATWKCWTPSRKEDVYLTCRELKGTLKASLHESGSWHIAYETGSFDTLVRQQDRTAKGRFIDKWQTPAPLQPGIILAFRIVTSWGSVSTPDTNISDIFCAPKPGDGRAIEFDLFIVDPSITVVSGWPGKDKMKTELVGSYALPSGRTVWVVYWDIPMPKIPGITAPFKYFEGRGPEDLTGSNLRALLFGDEPDGSKVIYDCKLMRAQDKH